MKPAFAAMLCSLAMLGQDAVPARQTSPGDSEKPSPREKARELLDSVAEMTAAANPKFQVTILRLLGEGYSALDREKSLDYLKQAFAAAGALPPENASVAGWLHSEIVQAVAEVDPAEAFALLTQVPKAGSGYDPRLAATDRIVERLFQKRDVERAIEVVETMGSLGAYSYSSINRILQVLPQDDSRRTLLFSAALTAYRTKPEGSFPQLLGTRWRDLPRPLIQAALDTTVSAILNRKEETHRSVTFATSKGSFDLVTTQEQDLFDLVHILREFDPKRAGELLEKYPALRTATDIFPEGSKQVAATPGTRTYTAMGPSPRSTAAMEQTMKLAALDTSRMQMVLAELKEDPEKALALVPAIPTAGKRAEALATIAGSVGEREPARARSVLGKCLTLLEEVKHPQDRMEALDAVAQAAHLAGDEKLVWLTLDRIIADGAQMLEADSSSRAAVWRDTWTSTAAFRRAAQRAVKCFGVDAALLLDKIRDTDHNLFIRIEIAKSLLGRPSRLPIFVRRP